MTMNDLLSVRSDQWTTLEIAGQVGGNGPPAWIAHLREARRVAASFNSRMQRTSARRDV
jgi:hypothetical protein